MYFRHKNVEIGPNCSHEIATFLKYHMPLNWFAMCTKRVTYQTTTRLRKL